MENQIFDFKRFQRYFNSNLRACISKYGITFLVLCTIPVTTAIFKYFIFNLQWGAEDSEWAGMAEPLRIGLFIVIATIVIMTVPSKLYGEITDKKFGTSYLLIPSSRVEKYVTMVLISCIIFPIVFILIYLLFDMLVCWIDTTSGVSMMSRLFVDLPNLRRDITSGALMPSDFLNNFTQQGFVGVTTSISNVMNPWLYVDDIIQLALMFMLGAIIFKSGKLGKTLGSLILITMALQLLSTPFAIAWTNKLADLRLMNGVTWEDFRAICPFMSWAVEHLALLDTISDITINVLLLFFIWRRCKKLSH